MRLAGCLVLEGRKFLLQAALEAVQSEIRLFGLASLLLNLFENSISSICSE